MEILKKFTNKQLILISLVALIILGTIGFYFYKNIFMQDEYDYENIDGLDEEESIVIEAKDIEEVEEKVIIHITGCIKNQGIVILNHGERVIDAIEKAGGVTEEADLNKINLAYELQDGEKLYIPSKNDEDDEQYLSSGENKYVSNSYDSESKGSTIININKATKEELQTLNGIGESMANKIIKYREENGKFENIEDIKNVPGIGDAKFNNIKDYISVK